MTDIPLVLLLGIFSTIQTHLAKALERQGIEVLEQIKDRLQKSGGTVEGGLKMPVIYAIDLVLNNTLFIWSPWPSASWPKASAAWLPAVNRHRNGRLRRLVRDRFYGFPGDPDRL